MAGEQGPTGKLVFDASEAWDDAETIIRICEVGPRDETTAPAPPPPAHPLLTAPDFPVPNSESLPPTSRPRGQRRLLPLGFGLALGMLVTTSTFAAFQRPAAIGLSVPETAVGASTMAFADGRRTADFEITPFEVASRQPQRSLGARKRTGSRRERAPVTGRVSTPSEGDTFALLESKARTCSAGQSGTARLKMKVQPSGMISHAIVYGRGPGASQQALHDAPQRARRWRPRLGTDR